MADNTRLPIQVERGAVGGAGYQTVIVPSDSGLETRIIKWDFGRGQWDVGYGIANVTLLQQVNALFRSRKGKGLPFKFKDWSDFQATGERFGTADATTTTFQLIKSYTAVDATDGTTPVGDADVRTITAPITSTITLKNDGSTISPVNYTIGSTGIVTFTVAPSGSPGKLTWSGEFDVIVRFDIDSIPINMQHVATGSISGIAIVEVIGE